MRVAGYVRISDEERAREGYGLASQERSIRALCEAHGWELARMYVEPGRSAKNITGRPVLTELLEDARSKRFDQVTVWKLDRLARNLKDLLAICEELEGLGIAVSAVQESFDSGTAVGRMLRNVLGAFGQFERETIVERIKAGLLEKARQGELLGRVPLGYRRTETGTIEFDPITAPLIREAYLKYATGQLSLRDMSTWAAAVGLRSQDGNPLDRLSVRKLLTNVSYTGQVAHYLRQGGGVVAQGKHPAIVDVALFAEVQGQLQGRRRLPAKRPYGGKEAYPLTGVAVCGYDWAPLLGFKGGSRNLPYMRCSTAQRRGKDACEQPMVRSDILEAQITAYVGGMRLPSDYLGEIVADLRQRNKSVVIDPDAGERLEREINRWQRLFVLGEIDEVTYRHETAPLRRQLAKVERPVEVLEVQDAASYLLDVGKLWSESDREQQRDFVRRVFSRIVVQGRAVTELTPQPAFAPLFVLDRRERFGGEMGAKWLPEQDSNLQQAG